MPLAIRNALSSPSVLAAANKAGFDLNNPVNVSRLLAYAGVSGFQLETGDDTETRSSGQVGGNSAINASLLSPAVQVASQQAGLDLSDSTQLRALFGLSEDTLAISPAGIFAAEQAIYDARQSGGVSAALVQNSQLLTERSAPPAATAYAKNALRMYAQIAAMG